MSAGSTPGSQADRLVEAYRAIDLRMQGLPFHNPRLAVEGIGFQREGPLLVGVLVTPWFVNLVALGLPLPAVGQEMELELPGGCFAARGASPAGVDHLAVSLASPVLHFADQVAARAFAEESLRLVLHDERSAPAVTGRRGLLSGLLGG